MTNTVPLILRLLSSCVPIANHAGKIIRDVMKAGELHIVDKGRKDYQTEADRRAQQFIISTLLSQFPNITIIGEEDEYGGNRVLDTSSVFSEQDESILSQECPDDLLRIEEDQVTVWVDPLDGTTEYTRGFLEHVTVLIGIAVGTKAVAGVIHQPYYGHNETEDCGRTVWGVLGLGAYGYTPVEPPADRMIITTTRSHLNDSVKTAVESLNADEVLRVGGAGHKVLLLLEGKAHVYIFARPGCKKWDTCAPEAVLQAAGGWLTDVNGECYSYNKETDFENNGGVFATAKKEDHTKFIQLLPQNLERGSSR